MIPSMGIFSFLDRFLNPAPVVGVLSLSGVIGRSGPVGHGLSLSGLADSIERAFKFRRLAAVALLHGGHFDFFEDDHRAAACPANYIGRISPRPLLMINGENDADYLPETAVRPLQDLLQDPKRIIWTDAGHGFLSEDDRTTLVDWLRSTVR